MKILYPLNLIHIKLFCIRATIKFMRLNKMRNASLYPKIDDIVSGLVDDIKTKLLESKP